MSLQNLLSSLKLTIYALDRAEIAQWWDYPGMSSPFTRLYVVLDGEAEVRHGGQSYSLLPGRMVLVPPFATVDYYCPSTSEMYYVMFTAELIGGTELFALPGFTWTRPSSPLIVMLCERLLQLNPDRALLIYDPTHKDYDNLIWQAADRVDAHGGKMETDAIVRVLLSGFIDQLDNTAIDSGMVNLIDVLQYINTHIAQPITLKELADVAGLHPTYFSDQFVEKMGVRPSVYIRNKRMEKAQLLMTTTSMPIKTIAAEVGFTEANYFFRVFKGVTGMTPSQYRKQRG